jgi:ABC-type transport system involved in multi-copper enzyme maturation permease subunit
MNTLSIKNLLRIEWYKVRGHRAFWVITALFVVLVPLMYWAAASSCARRIAEMSDMMNEGPEGQLTSFYNYSLWQFRHLWVYLPYMAAILGGLLLGIYVLVQTNIEVTARTLRQSIINGQSRGEFFLGKVFFILAWVLAALLLLLLVGYVLGGLNPQGPGTHAYQNFEYILGFAISSVGYAAIALWLGLMSKRSAVMVGVFVLLPVLIEPLIGSLANVAYIHFVGLPDLQLSPEALAAGQLPGRPFLPGDYLPFSAFSALFGSPDRGNIFFLLVMLLDCPTLGAADGPESSFLGPQLLAALGYCALFLGLARWQLNRGDH